MKRGIKQSDDELLPWRLQPRQQTPERLGWHAMGATGCGLALRQRRSLQTRAIPVPKGIAYSSCRHGNSHLHSPAQALPVTVRRPPWLQRPQSPPNQAGCPACSPRLQRPGPLFQGPAGRRRQRCPAAGRQQKRRGLNSGPLVPELRPCAASNPAGAAGDPMVANPRQCRKLTRAPCTAYTCHPTRPPTPAPTTSCIPRPA
jgi:hypothetical protein